PRRVSAAPGGGRPPQHPPRRSARGLLAGPRPPGVDRPGRRRLESRLFVADEPEASAEAGLPGATLSPLDEALLAERRVELRREIARLPERYRVVLALRYYGELSYDDIAGRLGLTRNHVATL